MSENKQAKCRKWQITINNPAEKGYTHTSIKEKLEKFSSLKYWCMADEVGEAGTYHTHIYLVLKNGIRFTTIQNIFEGGHLEMVKGSNLQNRDYVFKQGKWSEDKKKETNLIETQEEYGVLPVEEQGKRNDLINLYEMIKEGRSNYEILEENPVFMMKMDKIEQTRQTIREEKYKNTFRAIDTTYIWGSSGTGKTRGVMEQYGYENVFRITDYKNPFDSYKGQDVIVFEEFRSSLKIQDMLNYLDGYPLELPCRYNNKVACYTKVYIITNIALEQQYESVQEEYPETWKAFLRRIHTVKEYNKTETDEVSVINKSCKEYMLDEKGFIKVGNPTKKTF